MRAHIATLAVVLLASPVAFAAQCQEGSSGSLSRVGSAFNKQDAKALGTTYSADAALLPPTHQVVQGEPEIAKVFSGFFANGVTNHRLELIDAVAMSRPRRA
jgi:hypothetical protein